jgi:hypothetical protein
VCSVTLGAFDSHNVLYVGSRAPSLKARPSQFTTSVTIVEPVILRDVPWTVIWYVPFGVPVYGGDEMSTLSL